MKTKEVVNKAYKFRIYPTKKQEVFFAKHFGCTRFIYNYLLGVRRDAYQKEGKSISGIEAKKLIPCLKRQEEILMYKLMQQEGSNLFLSYLNFDYEGTYITDQYLDESGRFEVTPVEYYGETYLKALENKLTNKIRNNE